MNRRAWLPVLLVAAMPVSVVRAGDIDAATLARQGNGHGAVACSACHGTDGGGQAAAGFPRLAGINAQYLRKQLDDFASAARVNAVMQPVARALSVDERNAVAAYYAGLPVPAQTQAPAAASGIGAALAERGRWSDNVPACAQCHGPGGIGVGAQFPPLAGQSATYIANQLKAWQQGTRSNDPLQLMQHVTRTLSTADIAAVSAYYAALPVAPAPGGSTP